MAWTVVRKNVKVLENALVEADVAEDHPHSSSSLLFSPHSMTDGLWEVEVVV